MTRADEPIALDPGEGEEIGGNRYLSVRPELSLSEGEVKPGDGVQPHFHKGHSDSFYVLEGEIEFHLGDEVVNGTPGTYVLAPPNAVHSFRNISDKPARLLNLHTPGGFAEYRRELEALRAQGIEPDDAFFEAHDVFDA
jgi:quercetin dioxygenase-like cupin family protein